MAVHHHEDSSSNFLMLVVLLIFFAFVLWFWGLPALRKTTEEGVNINIPSQIDVNINREAPQQ